MKFQIFEPQAKSIPPSVDVGIRSTADSQTIVVKGTTCPTGRPTRALAQRATYNDAKNDRPSRSCSDTMPLNRFMWLREILEATKLPPAPHISQLDRIIPIDNSFPENTTISSRISTT